MRAVDAAGAGLDPASPVEMIDYVLHLCDIILIMTVNPGYAGKQFLPEMLPKIRRIAKLCEERGVDLVLEVDGGQNWEHAAQAVANAIVAGSAIFGDADYRAAIAKIRASAARASPSPLSPTRDGPRRSRK